jgi:hydroxymethylbilane synthase
VEDQPARRAVDAERAFLAELGGGCDVPVGALAAVDGAAVTLTAVLASLDGRVVLRGTARGEDPAAVGRDAARRLLDDHGGRTLLEDVA